MNDRKSGRKKSLKALRHAVHKIRKEMDRPGHRPQSAASPFKRKLSFQFRLDF